MRPTRRSFRDQCLVGYPLPEGLPGDGRLVILDTASPVSARKTSLFSCLLRNYDFNEPIEPFVDYNVRVFEEDCFIVESQYPEDLPIDLQRGGPYPDG